MRNRVSQFLGACAALGLALAPIPATAQIDPAPPVQPQALTVQMPADTRVLVETLEKLVGKKGNITEGQNVRARVWRDVIVDKRVVIAKGTPVLVKVDFFKRNKIAGRKGRITLGAYEVVAADGTPVALGGGYQKEGKGRVALVATLSAVIFVPLIFIKGKKAELPEGTVFDAFTAATTTIAVQNPRPAMTVSLGETAEPFSATLLYDALEGVEKPKMFPIEIIAPQTDDPKFVIDRINSEEPKKVVKVENITTVACEESCTYRGEIPIKKLFKQFKKGLNTIEVADVSRDGERRATQVLVDIEI